MCVYIGKYNELKEKVEECQQNVTGRSRNKMTKDEFKKHITLITVECHECKKEVEVEVLTVEAMEGNIKLRCPNCFCYTGHEINCRVTENTLKERVYRTVNNFIYRLSEFFSK